MKGFWRVSLGTRVLGFVLLVCALLALATASTQIAMLYDRHMHALLSQTAQADRDLLAHVRTISSDAQDAELGDVLHGALMSPDIDYIAVQRPGRGLLAVGALDLSALSLQSYELGPAPGGLLTIGRSLTPLRQTVARQAVPILLTQLTEGLLISLAVLLIFERLAARRLRRLTQQVLCTSWRSGADLSSLERNTSVLPDEIDNIINAFETMRHDARDAFAKLEREQQRGDRLNGALRTVQNEQASLTRALSHELITPVNTMRTLVSEFCAAIPVSSAQSADETTGLLQDMEMTAARMMSQVRNIMRYSELLATSPCFENLALEEVLRSARQTLVEHHSVKTDQITWGPLGQVQGDRRDLSLLFEAILTNAFTYAHPDRTANVRVQRVEQDNPDHIKIIISDNGRGLPAQHIEAVLDLFSRLHTYADIPGTGLGLALCRRVMQRHNGTIQLSSNLGHGTNVTLCFPKGETR